MIMRLNLREWMTKDEGLTFQQFQQHMAVTGELNLDPEVENKFDKVEVEDLGEDLEEDLI